jgi:hypothetical protein
MVPVVHERLVRWADPGFIPVGLVERFDLAYGARPPYTGDYVLNPVSTAELRELRSASPCRI